MPVNTTRHATIHPDPKGEGCVAACRIVACRVIFNNTTTNQRGGLYGRMPGYAQQYSPTP